MNTILFLSADSMFKQKNVDIFIQNGFLVSESYDCKGAFILLDKSKFDVVVIDEKLSDGDGYEACKRMRQYSGALIILLGTETDDEMSDRVEQLGFNLYIKKPVSPQDLVDRVKGLLLHDDKAGQTPTVGTEPETQVSSTTSGAENTGDVPVKGGTYVIFSKA